MTRLKGIIDLVKPLTKEEAYIYYKKKEQAQKKEKEENKKDKKNINPKKMGS